MHWTYEAFDPASDLEQGDIIAPTTRLRENVLRGVHPHFDNDKYLGFIVATQSCDIVRRKGNEPKARYISIATIRSLKATLPRLLGDVIHEVAPGLFKQSSKAAARQFLERLFDQNEQSFGLFYLHADGDVGIGEPAVAFLRVKVAIAAQHYDELVMARRGRLSPEFRGKLGWLLGNLYSRAASKDWSDSDGGDKAVKQMIREHLQEQVPGFGPQWVDDELVEIGKEHDVQFADRDYKDVLADLEPLRPKPKIERVIEAVLKDAAEILNVDADQLKRLKSKLDRNNTIKKCVK